MNKKDEQKFGLYIFLGFAFGGILWDSTGSLEQEYLQRILDWCPRGRGLGMVHRRGCHGEGKIESS